MGTLTGLLYVWLEIKHYKAMWAVGIAMSLCYIAVFAAEGLYASMGLYVYYFVISIYGWLQWNKQSRGGVLIRSLTRNEAVQSVLLLAGGYALAVWILKRYTDDPYPWMDAAVTTLNVVATWLLTRSVLEQWLLLVLANALPVGLYLAAGLYATTGLFVVYLGCSVAGYIRWRRQKAEESGK